MILIIPVHRILFRNVVSRKERPERIGTVDHCVMIITNTGSYQGNISNISFVCAGIVMVTLLTLYTVIKDLSHQSLSWPPASVASKTI